jgi:MFS family permease
MLSGSLADRLGRRRVFQTGLLLFTIGSLLCSLAPGLGWLVGFRMLQAVGGSMLNPVAMAIIVNTFTEPAQRARAIGVWGSVVGLSLAAGIIEGPRHGWGSPLIIGCFAAALLAAIGVAVTELHRRDPLIDIRFFRSAPFSGATVIALAAFAAMGGFLFLNTLYLQTVRGYSPVLAGLLILPMAVTTAATAPLSGRLVAAGRGRWALVIAGTAIAAGAGALVTVSPATPVALLAVVYVVFGVGFGVVNPPISNTAITGMPAAQAGVAASVASTSRQVGSALGVAITGTLVAGRGTASFTAGSHHGWAVIGMCGLAVVLTGLASTSRRARRSAQRTYDLLIGPPAESAAHDHTPAAT